MKTTEELKVLKEEFEALNKQLAELTEEELTQVSGGGGADSEQYDKRMQGDSSEENTGKSDATFP